MPTISVIVPVYKVGIRFQVTAVDLAQKAARTRELHIAPLETHLGIGYLLLRGSMQWVLWNRHNELV